MNGAAIALLVVVTAAGIAVAPAAANGGNGGNGSLDGLEAAANSPNRSLDLRYQRGHAASGRPGRVTVKPAAEQRTPRFDKRMICYNGDGRPSPAPDQGWCESGVPVTARQDCEQLAVLPTWRQWEYPDGTTSEWELLDRGSCTPVLPVLTVEDFRSLPLPAPVLLLQPDQDWVLVNIDTIVMTDPSPVMLRTSLAGFGVDVEAVPTLFTYDFGDGHDLVTRSVGRPYPDHDTSHAYEVPGTYAITLTTEWVGRYRVDGDPTWREVTGTASTSTTSAPFEAQERTSRLVSGLCTDRPKPPDC